MKRGKSLILLIFLLLFLGITIGGSLGGKTVDSVASDFENSISNIESIEDTALFLDETKNVFVIVARHLDNLVSKGVALFFNLISKILGYIFGI